MIQRLFGGSGEPLLRSDLLSSNQVKRLGLLVVKKLSDVSSRLDGLKIVKLRSPTYVNCAFARRTFIVDFELKMDSLLTEC